MGIDLYIVRHGQTEENLQRILQGQMPGHLTEEGIHQAEEARNRLKDIPFQCIITSDLKRAVDTANIISEAHQCPLILEPLLRERDFGIHTGGPYISISHQLDPSAETMEQLAQRAADFLNKLTQNSFHFSLLTSHPLLVISHGLFLRVLQAVYHGVPVRSIEKMENAEVRTLELRPDMHFSISNLEETGGTAN